METYEDNRTARLVARARKEITAGTPLIPMRVVDRIVKVEDALRVRRNWRDVAQLVRYARFKSR